MRDLIEATIAAFKGIPTDLISYLARIGVGTTFFRSGMLKVEGWAEGNTLALFQEEYRLPVISPEIAAYLATGAELALPLLLFAGLGTRFAAAALLVMTLVIEIFVYPNAFDTHGVWAVSLLFLMKYGAGTLSLDRLVESRWPSTSPMQARS
ncbi:MAG: DoxX family protein [Hyphomicrobium sp.]|jgi:putative oxidoreductase